MADEFPDHEGKVIYLAAENSRRGPIDALEADFVPLYSTVLLEPEPPEGDVVVLASGSAARAYSFVGGSAPAISIGPETTRVAGSVGIEVVGEAKTHDLDGLVAAVAEYAAAKVGVRLHHVPDRLRAAGRLRRSLPGRDEADRARRGRSSTSPTGSRRRR